MVKICIHTYIHIHINGREAQQYWFWGDKAVAAIHRMRMCHSLCKPVAWGPWWNTDPDSAGPGGAGDSAWLTGSLVIWVLLGWDDTLSSKIMHCFIVAVLFCILEKMCVCMCVSRSVVSNSATPWTVAYQAPLPLEFSRQEYWSG